MQFVPVMTIDRFAELVGVSTPTVTTWLNRGYLPSTKVGKRRLVDVASIARDNIENDDALRRQAREALERGRA